MRLYWNGTKKKKIWDKRRTQGKGSAPQCRDLAPGHRATTRQIATVPGGRLWHPNKEETSYPKAREDS